jgi:hypothetical protein
MASETFAMEAVAELATALYERGNYDIRLEAAVAKMWNTERGWRIVDDTLQIRGGRGYETADSLRGRGEAPIPIERALRDFRINLIFEGSSEIMRLFIAREAVDEHFSRAFDIVRPGVPLGVRARAALKSAPFYATWYPARVAGLGRFRAYSEFGRLAGHLRWADRATNRLGRRLFHAMLRYGPKLERRQMVLFRAVDVGAELFAMAAACSRAQALGTDEAVALADCFCRESRARAERSMSELHGVADRTLNRIARQVLDGSHAWLEQGTVGLHVAEELTASSAPEQVTGNLASATSAP